MAKSEKLFEVLDFIRECPDLTPKDLAQLCNVSERAIYRYLKTLSEVGISISFENGGYKLKGDYDDILGKLGREGLEAIKLLISSGLETCENDEALNYGRKFMKLIDIRLPHRKRNHSAEIELVPKAVRANHRGGTIVIGQGSKPDIINPILTSETISVSLLNLIFSSLIRFDGAQRPVPDLARNWEISKDGLVWTFFIRDDVFFHDGYPLTADDVEFTYRSIMEPKNESPLAKQYDVIDRLETEGDYIFRIFLKYPFAPFMCRLTREIAPRHLLENVDIHQTPFNRNPVGSGPFKLTDWMDDDTIVLEANSEYFRKDRPILDRLVFKSYPDRKSALKAIARDEMDIALNLSASDFAFAGRHKTFSTYPIPGPFYYAMILNLKDPVFRDIRTRLALDYVISKDSIVRKQLKGNGKICTGPFDTNSWAYNPDVQPTSYSIERAKELLAKAGWTDSDEDGVLEKDGKAFEISLRVPNISDILEGIGEAIKSQLARIGILVNLNYMENSKSNTATFQAMLTMVNAGADPDYTYTTWHSEGGLNLASYKNEFVDNLFDLGRRTEDLDERKSIYHKIHEMIHDDCPAIFFASGCEHIGSSYIFRNENFSSMIHFLTTMKDWQIVDLHEGEDSSQDGKERMML